MDTFSFLKNMLFRHLTRIWTLSWVSRLEKNMKSYSVHQVGILRGHEAPVLCAIFDPRGQLLASTSCDGSLRVWDLENGNVSFTTFLSGNYFLVKKGVTK